MLTGYKRLVVNLFVLIITLLKFNSNILYNFKRKIKLDNDI